MVSDPTEAQPPRAAPAATTPIRIDVDFMDLLTTIAWVPAQPPPRNRGQVCDNLRGEKFD
jgi:hypothetical protein